MTPLQSYASLLLPRLIPSTVQRLFLLRSVHNNALAPPTESAVASLAAAAFTSADYMSTGIEWVLGGALPDHLDPLDVTSRTTRHDVLDLSAGTGELSRAVLQARPDLKLVGVDPVTSMCAQYAREVPNADVLQGNVEAIPLLDNSVYTVIVGEQFRQLATPAALSEISRVLAPGGGLGLIWSSRDSSVPWVRALDNIVAPYYNSTGGSANTTEQHQSDTWKSVFEPDSNALTYGTEVGSEESASKATLLFRQLESRTLRTVSMMTSDQIVEHVLSSTGISELSKSERATVKRLVREVIHEHPDVCSVGSAGQPQESGMYALPYITEVYVTRSLKQAVASSETSTRSRLSVEKVASDALQLDDFFSSSAVAEGDEEEDDDEDFVDFTNPETGEWNSPTRGGKRPEPTRHGDWHHMGRCTDFS